MSEKDGRFCSMMHPFYYAGKERETYLNCIRLRYELIPYIYSAAIEGALTGMPMVRSMPLVFPDDRAVDDMTSQYMFGPSLCVGIFTDEIYLPEGTWTDAPMRLAKPGVQIPYRLNFA